MKQSIDNVLMEQFISILQNVRRQMGGGEMRRNMPNHHREHPGARFGSPEGHSAFHRRFSEGERSILHHMEENQDDQFGSPEEHAAFHERLMGERGFHHGFPPFFGHGEMHGHRPPMARERILHMIEEEEGISQKKLADSLFIRPQSLSELLTKLEKDGYISRTQNEDDKRETLVYLTEEGKSRAKEVEASRESQAANFFMSLTESEKETLSALLTKLIEEHE